MIKFIVSSFGCWTIFTILIKAFGDNVSFGIKSPKLELEHIILGVTVYTKQGYLFSTVFPDYLMGIPV